VRPVCFFERTIRCYYINALYNNIPAINNIKLASQVKLIRRPNMAILTRDEPFVYFCKIGDLAKAKREYTHLMYKYHHIRCDDDKLFRLVCSAGHLKIAKWLRKICPKINVRAKNDYAFVRACTHGHVGTARWLLKIQPDINVRVNRDESFRWACVNNHMAMARWILYIRPDTNIGENNCESFRMACYRGNLLLAKWILQRQSRVTADMCGSIICHACTNNCLSIAQWILSVQPHCLTPAHRNIILRALHKVHPRIARWQIQHIPELYYLKIK